MLAYRRMMKRRSTILALLVVGLSLVGFSRVLRPPTASREVVRPTRAQNPDVPSSSAGHQSSVEQQQTKGDESPESTVKEDESPALPPSTPCVKVAPLPKKKADKKRPRGKPPPPPPPSFNFTIDKPDGCTVPANVEATFSDFPKQISLYNIMEILQAGANPGVASRSEERHAVCKFRRFGNYAHFPHMMQQITRCFSFWQNYATLYEPYLYMYVHVHARENDVFNDGMFAILTDVFNVKLVYEYNEEDKSTLMVKPLYDTGMEESVQQGIAFQRKEDAEVLRTRVYEHYQIEPEGCQADKDEPVIGILNRAPEANRTILNVNRLQTYLQKLTNHQVKLVYFEGKSFLEQITFMSQVDILVSPHGAQMTSLNFMPMCGGIFEVRQQFLRTPANGGRLAFVIPSLILCAFLCDRFSQRVTICPAFLDRWHLPRGSIMPTYTQEKMCRRNGTRVTYWTVKNAFGHATGTCACLSKPPWR
jgi:hypothetical protein